MPIVNGIYESKKGPWAGKKISAEKRNYRGAPTIFVNGKPIHGGFVGTRGGSHLLAAKPEGVAPLSYNGTDYQMVFVGPDGEFDTAPLENCLAEIFDKNPQALGGVVLGMRPSKEWVKKNREEMPVAEWPIDWLNSSRPDASWASEVWRKDSVKAVSHIAARLHKVFSGRIIFYQIGAGRCGENGPQIHVDHSKPLLRHLRSWLRKFYKNNVKELQRCWSSKKVNFDNALPPDMVEEMSTEWFALRSPLRRQTADYFSAYSKCVEETILLWMEAVKEATLNQSLTASPAGSVLDAGLHADLHGSLPKNTFRGYVESPYLDMVESPASYTYRDLGRGDTTTLQPMGSVQLAGKMQMRDYDDRTHLTAWKGEEFPKCRLWQPPKDAWGDKQMMIRNTAYSLMKNGAFWWHELERDMFSHSEHVKTVKRLQSVGRGVVHADRRMSGKGLAVFVQPEANFLQASSNRLIFSMNYEARQLQWAHAGMASNIFTLADAGHPDLPSPKVIMVTNAFTMTMKEANAVKALARKNNAAIVWLVAPGIQQKKGFDLAAVRKITGFNIKAFDIETLPRITMNKAGGTAQPNFYDSPYQNVTYRNTKLAEVNWTDERPVSSFGGGQFDADDMGARGIGPAFYIDVDKDSKAQVLGELDFIQKPGLAMKECDGYRSIYCAAPYLHKALLRQLGKEVKAHIYLDSDDLVHTTRELIMVNANRAGKKNIKWPRKAEVVIDLFRGKEVFNNVREWSVNLKKYETRFYYAGSAKHGEKILAAMKNK
ncbi:MAG: hypothetical protein ACYTFY_05510 [Planctomycetota bacterium]|jgi:hypothetical protein